MAVDFWLCLATLLTLGVLSQGQERYAPGVPPPQPGAGGKAKNIFFAD